MAFEQDLFISYAHIDDQPLTPGQQGWIARFHATLQALLSMRLGQDARIWRDEKLRGNDVFSEEIVRQFTNTRALVSILSSRYLASEWCTREVREFCETAVLSGGLSVGGKCRVFKVVKTPVDTLDALPGPMRDVLGYDFFAMNEGTPLELDPAYGQEYAQLYNQRVAKLAWDVAQLFKAQSTGAGDRAAADDRAGQPPVARPTVYLAECSYDRKQTWDVVQGELKRLGYPVLPESRLPAGEAEYVAVVDSLLARSALSIHLVGENYGAVPDGPTMKSAAVLQNELAVARAKGGGLQRLIWLPDGTRSAQPPQQAFIDALHQDGDAQFGADLITGDLEELRAAIHATLKKIEHPAARSASACRRAAGLRTAHETALHHLQRKGPQGDDSPPEDVQGACARRRAPGVRGRRLRGSPRQSATARHLRRRPRLLRSRRRGVEADDRQRAEEDGGLSPGAGAPGYTWLAEPATRDKEDLIDMEEPNLIAALGGADETGRLQKFTAALGAIAGGRP